MNKKHFFLAIIMVTFFLTSGVALAAPSFYEGKTIRIIVGYSAGGGYDTYARLISRHMARYIPGNPAIVVENMTGAGGLVAANYMYKVAKPDGLTIGNFDGGLAFNQVLQQPGIQFDAQKFIYLGTPGMDECVYVFSKKSGITNMEKWMAAKAPLKMGGLAPGNYNDNLIRLLRAALGLPIQLVSGYKGTADIRLAVEQGELDGSSWAWASMRSTWRKSLESGEAIVVLQAVDKPSPDLPKVPLAINYAKTSEARQLIEVIQNLGVITRPYVLPPGTPREQAQTLTAAYSNTLKDKDYLAEAENAKLYIKPVSVSELEKAVNAMFKLDSAMVVKLKDILFK